MVNLLKIIFLLLVLILLLLIILYIIKTNNKKSKNEYYHQSKLQDLLKIAQRFYLNPFVYQLIKQPENKMPINIKRFLEKYGDYLVTNIQICRKPIDRVVNAIVQIATFGEMRKKLNIRGLDDIFHLWANLKLVSRDGLNSIEIQIEKNSIVEIFNQPLVYEGCISIDLNKNFVSLQKLLENAEKVHPYPFWLYDASDNNCQEFIHSLLAGSGYITPSLRNYLYQDAASLFRELGIPGNIVRQMLLYLTNIGANVMKLYYNIYDYIR
jgi:hypothetical protein